MGTYSIGVDLGGTNLRVAAISDEGRVLHKVSIPAVYTAGPEHIASDITNIISSIRSRVGVSSLRGVGIGVPGFIDMEKGVVVGSANLPGFEGFPVRDAIQQKLGTTIVLENDANAAALGEMWIGAGRDVKDLILITLGTGIGGGIVVDGRVLHGHLGMAGEIGHMTVYPEGNPCGCGNCGCLEKHASATAVVAMARMMGLGDRLTSEEVYQLAAGGDDKAKAVFVAMGQALGTALATLVNVFNFPLYLLSGGMLPAWDQFAPTMLAECRRRSFVFRTTGTRIDKAALGNEAGLYGAAYLPYVT